MPRGQSRGSAAVSLAVVVTLALAGCRPGAPYEAGVPLLDETLASSLRQSRAEMYPVGAKTTERVVLTHGGQIAFTAYVAVGQPGHLRLLALSDFGNTLFEADGWWRQAPAQAVKNSSSWSDGVVTGGAWRDAATVYLAAPGPEATLRRYESDVVGLASVRPDGETEAFQFDAESKRLVRYVRAKEGQVRYQILFLSYEVMAGWPRAVPRELVVDDYEQGYSLNVHLAVLRRAEH
jgi:hypothetical protein